MIVLCLLMVPTFASQTMASSSPLTSARRSQLCGARLDCASSLVTLCGQTVRASAACGQLFLFFETLFCLILSLVNVWKLMTITLERHHNTASVQNASTMKSARSACNNVFETDRKQSTNDSKMGMFSRPTTTGMTSLATVMCLQPLQSSLNSQSTMARSFSLHTAMTIHHGIRKKMTATVIQRSKMKMTTTTHSLTACGSTNTV